MDFFKLITSRFSVRQYKSTPVDEDKLLKILDAGRLAPSAVNFQPWHFIVVDNKEVLAELHKAYKREWIKEAPVIIVACSDHRISWKRGADGKDFADVDISIAVDHMILQATELGLGTCWVCNFDVEKCSELLQIPNHIEPVVLIPIGYPDSDIPVKKRKSIEEITHRNQFSV